jgi:hypothetical protein
MLLIVDCSDALLLLIGSQIYALSVKCERLCIQSIHTGIGDFCQFTCLQNHRHKSCGEARINNVVVFEYEN